MDITTAFSQRNFLIPRSDFTLDSDKELIKLIMNKHGENFIESIKLIDDNEEYDSFCIKSESGFFCLKLSMDNTAIFYDYMVISGISSLNIAPQAICRDEIEINNKKIYYTIQTFEHSFNLMEVGTSEVVNSLFENIKKTLKKLNTFNPPSEVIKYLDDSKSFFNYHKMRFDLIRPMVVNPLLQSRLNIIETVYNDVLNEINSILSLKANLLKSKLVHGNLNSKTIIENTNQIKFINFENCFLGSPYFDLISLVFDVQMDGLKELDFVTKIITEMGFSQNQNKCGKELNEYKICKKIWTRKKFLDLLREYALDILVKGKKEKMIKFCKEISSNYYRYEDILAFRTNKNFFISEFQIILNID
jgi:hypothetical protein